MRTEIRWGLAAIIALAIGATCAQPYARLAAPWYAAVARLIAMDHPWQVTGIDVRPGNSNLTAQLQLAAEVFRYPGALKPVARVIGHVELGEVTETPLVFWTGAANMAGRIDSPKGTPGTRRCAGLLRA